MADGPHDYTLTIGGNAPEAMNTVRLAPGRVSFIVYRLYVPDQGVGPDRPRWRAGGECDGRQWQL